MSPKSGHHQRVDLAILEKSLDRVMIARQNEFDKVIVPAKKYPGVKAMTDFPEAIPEALEAYSQG